jgi:hypothetical protein
MDSPVCVHDRIRCMELDPNSVYQPFTPFRSIREKLIVDGRRVIRGQCETERTPDLITIERPEVVERLADGPLRNPHPIPMPS